MVCFSIAETGNIFEDSIGFTESNYLLVVIEIDIENLI
jgi:hypothetical protein